MRLACCAALCAALAGPASAQSFVDAVRTNFTVAADICLRIMVQALVPSATIPQAGFTYRRIEGEVNQFGVRRSDQHFFDAPNGTAQIEVLDPPDRFTGFCQPSTAHLGVAAAAGLVEGVIAYRFPTAERRTIRQPNGPDCPQWIIRDGGNLPRIATVRSEDVSAGCAETGAAVVQIEIPG